MLARLPFFLLAAAVALPASAEEIRIAASDLLADYIAEPLNAYGTEHSIEFKIDSIGSLPALDRLRSDEIDLAIIAVPQDTDVPRDEFRIYPFAYDVAVVAVNESNPINEISMSRLGGIFGSDEEHNYTSWGDLGLSGWGNRSIKALAGQTDESISLELFKFSVLRGGQMKTTVAEVKDSEVEDLLVTDAASIAILPRLPKSEKVKALMISSEANGPAFGPTDDNVHYGDYPIRLAFYTVYNGRDEERVKEVLRVLMSDEIAVSLRENYLFALPDTVRRKLTMDLDLGE
jgi:ABC-type phosphate transport system substrate-binding protein